jgi:hypothetical protein
LQRSQKDKYPLAKTEQILILFIKSHSIYHNYHFLNHHLLQAGAVRDDISPVFGKNNQFSLILEENPLKFSSIWEKFSKHFSSFKESFQIFFDLELNPFKKYHLPRLCSDLFAASLSSEKLLLRLICNIVLSLISDDVTSYAIC